MKKEKVYIKKLGYANTGWAMFFEANNEAVAIGFRSYEDAKFHADDCNFIVIPQPKDESKEVKDGGDLFTGGEWWQEINNNDYIDINGDDGFRICSVLVGKDELAEVERTVDEAKSNATLITKAPKMKRYIDYVHAKIECNEVPLPFHNWLKTPAANPNY